MIPNVNASEAKAWLAGAWAGTGKSINSSTEQGFTHDSDVDVDEGGSILDADVRSIMTASLPPRARAG